MYREVPLHRAARTALRAWLDERPQHRGAEDSRALLLSRRGERMRVRALRYVVAELGVDARLVHEPGHPDAGKSRVHPHTLRHTFGTQLQRNGVDIVVVADLMGHATFGHHPLVHPVLGSRSRPRHRPGPHRRRIDT